MHKVCWVSRHPPLKAQIDELKRIFGKDTEIEQINKTFRDAKEVIEDVKKAGCDVAVVVAPLSMIAELLKDKDIKWIRAEMEALHMCRMPCEEFDESRDVWLPVAGEEEGRHMRFKEFRELVEVKVVTRPLE